MPTEQIVLIIVLIIIAVILLSNIRIVQQADAYVIQRLGAYKKTWGKGIHFLIPFVDKVAKVVSLKEQIADFPPQPVITKDNITMQVDTVVFYCIVDPVRYAYGVEYPIEAIHNLSTTTMRNIIGEIELDDTLTSRDMINTRLRIVLDEATVSWGIKVTRVELKGITPPAGIRESMEKQAKAEREKRETIRRAEGEKAAKILAADGEKQSKILRAQGEQESQILYAEGQRQARILEAQGKAEAIRVVQKAQADGIVMLNDANTTNEVLRLKALETFEKVANGQATKIIIPSDLQGLANVATAFKEIPNMTK